MSENEVYTTTFEDVEKTAEEFGRVVIALPEYSQIIVLDDTLIGPGMIKQFDNTPYGYTLARRFAVRLCEEDETSERPFEELRAEHLAEIAPPEEEESDPIRAGEEDPNLDYRVSPPVRAYPPREVTEIERLSWSM